MTRNEIINTIDKADELFRNTGENTTLMIDLIDKTGIFCKASEVFSFKKSLFIKREVGENIHLDYKFIESVSINH